MKIKKIHLENHPFFGTKDIDFTGPDGVKPLNAIVIGGINGSGKTTLLQAIRKIMTGENKDFKDCYLELDISDVTGLAEYIGKPFIVNPHNLNILYSQNRTLFKDFERTRPRVVYMPTVINFDNIRIRITPYSYKYVFVNNVDEDVAKDVPTFFATHIDKYVYGRNKLPDESIKLACDDINSIFKELEIESWIVGLKKDGSRMPLFENKAGKIFDITGLSSGERQLFFRIMSLKMMEINNSIILVDEPEISLHPSWQQKIIKVYENIGANNQVIAATHSPHILSSVPNECIRLLVNTADIQVLDYKELKHSYGIPIKRALEDLMGLKSDRDPVIQSKIDDLVNDLKQGHYNPDEFDIKFKALEDVLGTMDVDLARIGMEKLRMEMKKRNAENK